METTRRAPELDGDGDRGAESATSVTVHSTSGDRVVFTETDNTDGWIATDGAVELRR